MADCSAHYRLDLRLWPLSGARYARKQVKSTLYRCTHGCRLVVHCPSATHSAPCLFTLSAGKAIYLLPARARTTSFVTKQSAPKGVTLTNNVSDDVYDQVPGIVHRELDTAAAEELSPAAPLPYVPKDSSGERV